MAYVYEKRFTLVNIMIVFAIRTPRIWLLGGNGIV